jgi:Uma2 family endonuclease
MGVAASEHTEPFTEEQFFALPHTSQRHELVDGTIVMSPAPSRLHQRIAFRLATILDQAVPAGLEVQEAVNVRLASGRIVIPDVAVLTSVGGVDLVVPAAEVLLMVEIISPSTDQIDRLLKPGLAAQAGIPFFVLIQPQEPAVSVRKLDNGSYQEIAAASGDEYLALTDPFPVGFRPADLLATRR